MKKATTQSVIAFTAGDRNRTGTGGKSRRTLSPVRLPVPPRRLGIFAMKEIK